MECVYFSCLPPLFLFSLCLSVLSNQDLYSHNAHGSSWIDNRWPHPAACPTTCFPCRHCVFLVSFWSVCCGCCLGWPVLFGHLAAWPLPAHSHMKWVSSVISNMPFMALSLHKQGLEFSALSPIILFVFSVFILKPPCPWSSKEGPLNDGSVINTHCNCPPLSDTNAVLDALAF